MTITYSVEVMVDLHNTCDKKVFLWKNKQFITTSV